MLNVLFTVFSKIDSDQFESVCVWVVCNRWTGPMDYWTGLTFVMSGSHFFSTTHEVVEIKDSQLKLVETEDLPVKLVFSRL